MKIWSVVEKGSSKAGMFGCFEDSMCRYKSLSYASIITPYSVERERGHSFLRQRGKEQTREAKENPKIVVS